jgi:hypothetical protein
MNNIDRRPSDDDISEEAPNLRGEADTQMQLPKTLPEQKRPWPTFLNPLVIGHPVTAANVSASAVTVSGSAARSAVGRTNLKGTTTVETTGNRTASTAPGQNATTSVAVPGPAYVTQVVAPTGPSQTYENFLNKLRVLGPKRKTPRPKNRAPKSSDYDKSLPVPVDFPESTPVVTLCCICCASNSHSGVKVENFFVWR